MADNICVFCQRGICLCNTELYIYMQATAGLRQLGVDASERILQAVNTTLHRTFVNNSQVFYSSLMNLICMFIQVKDFLKVKTSLKSNDDWVTVLDGTQEGAYQWVSCLIVY